MTAADEFPDESLDAERDDLDADFAIPDPMLVARGILLRAADIKDAATLLGTPPASLDILLDQAASAASAPWTAERTRGAAHVTLDELTGQLQDAIAVADSMLRVDLSRALLDVLRLRLELVGVLPVGAGKGDDVERR